MDKEIAGTNKFRNLKNRMWEKGDKRYIILKPNCKICMGKRYVIRTWPEKDRVKETVSSCRCVREENIKI